MRVAQLWGLLGCLSCVRSYSLAVSTTIEDCLKGAFVPIISPTTPEFALLAQSYNSRLVYHPAYMILPTSTAHISSAVLCAKTFGLKVQAKSGGHSYASFGMGGQDGSVIISLANFQAVSIDPQGIASVGGGVRLGNLAVDIFNQGQRALPHGVCPDVGIGGHASHGGYWFSSRAWGLTLDTIVGLDAVLANGSIIHASPTAYADVYWALRGAAESIGIITTFYFQTQPAPASVVNWMYTFPYFATSNEGASAVLHVQDFALNASVVDGRLGFGMTLNPLSFSVSGTYQGSEVDFRSRIAPELLRGLPPPMASFVSTFDWIHSLANLTGAPLPQALTLNGDNYQSNFYAKSILVPESSPLTRQALIAYFDFIIQNGQVNNQQWFAEINLLGGPGSAINHPSAAALDSAYSNRGALWIFQHSASSPSPPPMAPNVIGFVESLNRAIVDQMPGGAFGAYINYADPQLSAAQALSLYYSPDTLARLIQIKKAVDPSNVFANPQSIPLT